MTKDPLIAIQERLTKSSKYDEENAFHKEVHQKCFQSAIVMTQDIQNLLALVREYEDEIDCLRDQMWNSGHFKEEEIEHNVPNIKSKIFGDKS